MAEIQEALLQHERVRKATELPLFHGDRSKDSIDPEDFIRRFNSASDIARWVAPPANPGDPLNYHIKCQQFLSLLRHKAIEWWHSLELNPDNNYDDWEYIKDRFLQHYSPRYTARTACMSFSDLHQSNDENVGDYYLRVTKAYRLLRQQRPANINVVRHNPAPLAAGAAAAVINQAIADGMQVAKNEGLDDMGRYMVQAMFLAGLKEEIRIKTMETRPVTHQEAYQTALNIECIMKDKRGAKPMVSSIQQAEEDADFEIDEEEEDLLSQINAIRMKRGRRPARFAPKGNSSKVNITCRYCKATGHFQRDCFKRKKENGKMIDAAGKPYKINQIEEEDSQGDSNATPQEEEQAVQSIRDMSLSQLYFGGNINSIRDATGEDKASPKTGPPSLPLPTTERCECLKIWDIQKQVLFIMPPEELTTYLTRHGMTSADNVDEEYWICTCLEDMMEFRARCRQQNEWCYEVEPDAEVQEILEDTLELRSEWFETVGEDNPFEDKASRDTPSPSLQSLFEEQASEGQDAQSLN